jgi:predicted peptidase
MRQIVKTAHTTLPDAVALNYLLHLPEGYSADSTQTWPLILFLHGSGERGTDPTKVSAYGIAKIVEQRSDFPFITVSPQCPSDMWWTELITELRGLVDEISETYRVDTSRLYLTGLSMGGFGAWDMAVIYPHLFAAFAPICGGLSEALFPNICLIKNLPAWVFHGAKDDVVPLWQSEEPVKALQECGGDVRFTVYPNAGHNSWTETYNNPELYTWFLSHTRHEKVE